jgi:hypothetical protein
VRNYVWCQRAMAAKNSGEDVQRLVSSVLVASFLVATHHDLQL